MLLHSAIGIVWMVPVIVADFTSDRQQSLSGMGRAVNNWVPALSFSLGMDVTTTSMIAGRLVYYHVLQRKAAAAHHPVSYLPILVIFIESGALSAFSKVIQLVITFYGFQTTANPIVIPLCVSFTA
jgi:hypothetical protein